MKYFCIFLFLIFVLGCKNQTQETVIVQTQEMNIPQVADTVQKQEFNILLVSDSLLTDDQKEEVRKLRIKIAYLTLEKVCVEDNHLVLKATIQDFLDRGIPEMYYHLMVKELKETNQLNDSTGGIDNMYEVFEQTKQQYRDSWFDR